MLWINLKDIYFTRKTPKTSLEYLLYIQMNIAVVSLHITRWQTRYFPPVFSTSGCTLLPLFLFLSAAGAVSESEDFISWLKEKLTIKKWSVNKANTQNMFFNRRSDISRTLRRNF